MNMDDANKIGPVGNMFVVCASTQFKSQYPCKTRYGGLHQIPALKRWEVSDRWTLRTPWQSDQNSRFREKNLSL